MDIEPMAEPTHVDPTENQSHNIAHYETQDIPQESRQTQETTE